LGEDTGLPVAIPPAMSERLRRELEKGAPADSAAGLAALGEAALRARDVRLAYAASGAGLGLARESAAEFLFLRGRSIPDWIGQRQTLCLAAASELARRQRHTDLLARIGRWREEELDWLDPNQTDVAMSTKQIDDIIAQERKSGEFPSTRDDDDDFAEEFEGEFEDDFDEATGSVCPCPKCRAARAARAAMPTGGLPDFEQMVEQMAKEVGPEQVLRMLDELVGGRPPKRGKSRRRYLDDDPF
jgi:hypothetical protein